MSLLFLPRRCLLCVDSTGSGMLGSKAVASCVGKSGIEILFGGYLAYRELEQDLSTFYIKLHPEMSERDELHINRSGHGSPVKFLPSLQFR